MLTTLKTKTLKVFFSLDAHQFPKEYNICWKVPTLRVFVLA
jgi:hypothetical protein